MTHTTERISIISLFTLYLFSFCLWSPITLRMLKYRYSDTLSYSNRFPRNSCYACHFRLEYKNQILHSVIGMRDLVEVPLILFFFTGSIHWMEWLTLDDENFYQFHTILVRSPLMTRSIVNAKNMLIFTGSDGLKIQKMEL